MREAWEEISGEVARRCRACGLDLTAALRVERYNEEVAPWLRLPDFGRPGSLAIVVGNTRAMWPPFLRALRADARLAADEHPIEAFASDRVRRAAAAAGWPHEIRWAHDVVSGVVAIQQLAQVAGLAHLAPSHLSVHPVYGPWIALRAALVFDVPGPPGRPLPAAPCAECERACLPALRRALDGSAGAGAEAWKLWLAIRDACPAGRDFRYDDDQIAYHYTKDRRALRRALDAASRQEDDLDRR